MGPVIVAGAYGMVECGALGVSDAERNVRLYK